MPIQLTLSDEPASGAVLSLISAEAKLRKLCGQNGHADLQAAYEQLRHTQQTVVQQERLSALGQMATGLAHDVNNSLTPIIGYADFLLDCDPSISESTRKSLQCIRTAAGDIAQLVDTVRQFYRRRDESEPLPLLDLNAMVHEVVELTRPRWREIPQKEGIHLSLHTELMPHLPCVRESDSEVRQALTNLILNAVEAIPERGAVTIATRVAPLPSTGEGMESSANQVILEVRDTGVGMDQSTRQRCFEPFFSTKRPRGNGMGLPMVYGLMRRHQGSIEIDTEPGLGTTLRLLFRAAEVRTLANQTASTGAVPGPLRILCIDDDQRIGHMLQQVLSSQNHVVEVADDGQKGVEAFRRARERGQPFQVVITDLGMPNVDGRQIVRTVKQESPKTPVVMLTGWAAMMDEEGELPENVDAVVTKPPSINRLHEVLAQVTAACPAA